MEEVIVLFTKHIINEKPEIETVGFHSSRTELLDDSAKNQEELFYLHTQWTGHQKLKYFY